MQKPASSWAGLLRYVATRKTGVVHAGESVQEREVLWLAGLPVKVILWSC